MTEPINVPSGVRTGPLQEGEWVTFTDPKGKQHSVQLVAGKSFHTTKGGVELGPLIGGPDGIVATTVGGLDFLVMRPLLHDFAVSMPRGAAIIYPKEAAQIVMAADIFPGARVLEAGVGSGSLSMALLRAIGPTGRLTSYEKRPDFAETARTNGRTFFGCDHPAWDVRVGELAESLAALPEAETFDRVVLDMLDPWSCVDAVAPRLRPGGVLLCYVATTTQLGRIIETLRCHGSFTEPSATETIVRNWHAEGLAIRPAHGASSHTGFLITTRKMADGWTAPLRKRRPNPGAYGPDYHGPRPPWVTPVDTTEV